MARQPFVPIERIARQYDVLVWDDEHGANLLPSPALQSLAIEHGTLTMDGRPVANVHFDHDGASWVDKTAAHFTTGVLHFRPDALGFEGTVWLGANERDAVKLDVAGVTPPSVYNTKVANEGTADGTAAAGVTWSEAPQVTLGFQPRQPGQTPSLILTIGGVDATLFAAPRVEKDLLVVDIVYNPEVVSAVQPNPQWPAQGTLKFSWDAMLFHGAMQKYDAAQQQLTTKKFAWEGTLAAPAPHAARLSFARGAVPMQAQAQENPDLSLAELTTLKPTGVEDASFAMLVENMKWAIDDDWRTNFFGEIQPLLSPDRIKLIKQDGDFYRKIFAPAYLGWGFSHMKGPGAPKRPLSDAQKRKLKYFLHVGMANEKGYNRQSHGLFLEAFIQREPRLSEYIVNGGADWAQRMFDDICTPQQFNLMVVRVMMTNSMEIPKRLSTILTALQPTGVLAHEYNKRVVSACLSKLAPQVDLSDPKKTEPWLSDIIRVFIEKYLVAPENPTIEEARRQEMASELQKAVKTLGAIGKLGAAFASVLAVAKGDNLLTRSENASQSFGEKYPALARAGKFLLVAAWAGGLFSAIIGFQKWDKLRDDQRVALILSVVQLFGRMMLAVPEIISGVKTTINTLLNATKFLAGEQSLKSIALSMEDLNPDWFRDGARNIGEFFGAEGRAAVVVEESFFGKMFRGLKVAMKWLGVAISAAFAVVSTIDFVHEMGSDSPEREKAFSGIIACAAIADAVCTVLAIVTALAVFAAAAAVFAVIGVIFTLVMLFDPPPPPESPVDRFMRETVHPFVDALKDPPTDWQPLASPARLMMFVHSPATA
jgi:hypothetical protein